MNAEVISIDTLDENGRIMARYVELGQIAKNAKAEQETMKPEIVTALEDGEVFQMGDSILTLQDKETTTFSWQRAVNDGILTQEQANHYLKRTLSRFPVQRKV